MLGRVSAAGKLYLLIFITAVSIIGMGLYGITYVRKMNQNTHSLYVDRVLPFQQLATVRFVYSTEIATLASKVKGRTFPFKLAKNRAMRAQQIINVNWGAYKLTYFTNEEALMVKQADELKAQADTRFKLLFQIFSKEDTIALQKFAQDGLSTKLDPFIKKLDSLMELQMRVGKELSYTNDLIYQDTSKKFAFFIAFSLAVALSLSWYIVNNVRGLINSITDSSVVVKQSEEKYFSLFEQASDAICIMNADGNFTEVNNSLCELTGYTRGELLTMNVRVILNAEIIKMYPLVYAERQIGETMTGERKIVQKNGTIIDIEINGKKIAHDRMVIIGRDVTARKAMEAGIKNAEVKFRTLADKSMVGIYIVQNGLFTYVNPRFADVFGYAASELIGRAPVEAIVHPNYHAISNENIRLRVEGIVDSVHYEAMGKKKDGSTNWVEFYGSRAIFEEVPTIIGSMIDITERKIAEDELRSSEQKYKLLFESNPVPLWIIAKDDLSVIAVNAAAASLYGYTKEELLHTSVKKLRPSEDWEQQLSSYQKEITGSIDFGVVKHIRKNGSVIMVNIISEDIIFEGRKVRLSSTADVTKRLQAEELLKKTEANLQTILNTTDTAYALLDRDLRVLEYNDIALVFAKHEFNFDPNCDEQLFDHLPEHRRPQFLKYISDVFRGNTVSYEVTYEQPGERNTWYYVKMFPIANKENEILGMVLAISDITARKNTEQDLKTAYDQIKTNITFIREMIWKQSHILRSPLANLKGLTTILQSDPSDKEVLDHIKTELDRMDAVFIEMAHDSSADEMNF